MIKSKEGVYKTLLKAIYDNDDDRPDTSDKRRKDDSIKKNQKMIKIEANKRKQTNPDWEIKGRNVNYNYFAKYVRNDDRLKPKFSEALINAAVTVSNMFSLVKVAINKNNEFENFNNQIFALIFGLENILKKRILKLDIAITEKELEILRMFHNNSKDGIGRKLRDKLENTFSAMLVGDELQDIRKDLKSIFKVDEGKNPSSSPFIFKEDSEEKNKKSVYLESRNKKGYDDNDSVNSISDFTSDDECEDTIKNTNGYKMNVSNEDLCDSSDEMDESKKWEEI